MINLQNISNQCPFLLILYEFDNISNIIGYYVITAISLIGLILNVLNIKLLMHKSLKHEFYRYLMCKSILDSIVCLFGVGYLNNNCLQCFPSYISTYGVLFYRLYVIKIPLRMILVASVLSEVFLTLNRLKSFSNEKNTFNIALKYYLLVLITLPSIIGGIAYFSVEIKQLNQTHEFYWETTEFGTSDFYRLLSVTLLVVESVIPIGILVLFNCMVLIKFKSRIKLKLNLNIQSPEFLRKTEIRFTKLILILTSLYAIVHFLDTLCAILNRYYNHNLTVYDYSQSIRNFFRQITYFFLFLLYAFNIFIYIAVDPNLYKLVKDYKSFLNNKSCLRSFFSLNKYQERKTAESQQGVLNLSKINSHIAAYQIKFVRKTSQHEMPEIEITHL